MQDLQPSTPESRPAEAQDSSSLARLIRAARQKKGWTLNETASRARIGRSTLSKIENDQTSAGFEIIRRLTQVLDLKTPQLFIQSRNHGVTGRRDVTLSGKGERHATNTYEHELLCAELSSKAMVPYISRIKARDMADHDGWIRHSGEEFMYVLEGRLELHTEHYRPLTLGQGDSVYYDSGMGHCCISTSDADALVLWVSLEL
ncbi:MAG: helix-turn-helix domain-containing protein [Halocynthiibacter sp.]